MDVFWLETAIADIQEIVAYIEADNPAAARHVASGLYDAAADLAPTRGSDVGAEAGVRVSSSYPLSPSSSPTESALVGWR